MSLQLSLNLVLEYLDRLSFSGLVEKNEERQSVLCELLGIFEVDGAHGWRASLKDPGVNLLVVGDIAAVNVPGFVVV